MFEQDQYTRWIEAGIRELEFLANEQVEGIWEKRLRIAGLLKNGEVR